MLRSLSYAIKERGVMVPRPACLFLQNSIHRENPRTDRGSTQTEFGPHNTCDVAKPTLS